MSHRGLRECHCGSGLYAQAHYDARGIFLTFACEKCEEKKLSGFRRDVLTDPDYWHDEPLDED